ncbi:MAG: TolC family protein [Treponema sp.]|jgi:outer membrane protein TolC|nr:TolC family protein [Treponema sp.]
MNLAKRKTGGLKGLVCLFLLLCANLPAQEAKRLSPGEAVELAIKSNLSLETSRTGTAIKKRASDMSWNQFIPSVSVAGSLLGDNEKTTVTGMVPVDMADVIPMLPPNTLYGVYPYSVDAPQWHVAGSIQASLNINFAMFENMKRLRLDYEGGMLGYQKAKAQLERDIRKAYHNMLLVQENIALLRGSFENAERQVRMARDNYNAGLVPELTLLQAQVARENLRPIIDQAENGLKLAMAQFAMYLGLSYDTPFELIPVTEETSFIPLDVAEMIKKAASGKPDIQELRQNILLMQSARKAQVYLLTPSLNLSWNYNSAFIKDPWKDPWFDSKDDWKNSGSLTLSLVLRLHSLIPFSADFQGVKNLDDQITSANIGLAQMIQVTEIEIYNTVLALEKTRISAEAQAQTVDMAQRSYRLTEQAYQAGLQDLFQVQNAEQSLRQARVQMLEQQFNYLNGLIDLEYSIGVPYGTLGSN